MHGQEYALHSGYRSARTAKACIASTFAWHNETVGNPWPAVDDTRAGPPLKLLLCADEHLDGDLARNIRTWDDAGSVDVSSCPFTCDGDTRQAAVCIHSTFHGTPSFRHERHRTHFQSHVTSCVPPSLGEWTAIAPRANVMCLLQPLQALDYFSIMFCIFFASLVFGRVAFFCHDDLFYVFVAAASGMSAATFASGKR